MLARVPGAFSRRGWRVAQRGEKRLSAHAAGPVDSRTARSSFRYRAAEAATEGTACRVVGGTARPYTQEMLDALHAPHLRT